MKIEYKVDEKRRIVEVWSTICGIEDYFELPYDESMTEYDILDMMEYAFSIPNYGDDE